MITEKLGKEILFFDGAMGSLLQKRQLKVGELPESLNIPHKNVMIQIHSEYLAAGSNILTTNTFGAFSFKYEDLDEVVAAAVENAKTAIKNSGRNDCYIAFGLGPTGKLLKPMGTLPFEECVNIYKSTLKNAEKLGADLIIFETFTDLYELKAAITAAKETCSLPFVCTMSFDANGRTMTGCDLETMISLLEGLGASAIGVNCGLGPDIIKKFVPKIYKASSTPIMIQPNAGLPNIIDGETIYELSPEDFANSMEEICRAGAWILGGCCGTTPEHIKAMVEKCKNLSPLPVTEKNLTMASSYSKAVLFNDKPVIVGGRIDPANNIDLAKAIEEKDYESIIDEVTDQMADGANIIEINVSVDGVNEQEVLSDAIEAIQEVLNIPLQLNFTDTKALEKAMRIYNGKCFVHSISGKESHMAQVFPLLKKYGGVGICVTLDDEGIPDSVEKRLHIAEKIVQTAASYGIAKKDLLIDCAGTDKITTEALSLIKEKLSVRTILRVSDFNADFLSEAINAGLDACIVDPGSNKIQDVLGL